jgi:tRNA nucleotidyltransferase (CCA-adding enzyme)
MDKYFKNGIDVLKKLHTSGYEAFFVGGYVRDMLLGIRSTDIDITTSALPEEVIEVFENVKETGKKYGSVTVFIDKHKYEVTTFRSDGEYNDNRHPSSVEYTKNLKSDLSRRDFTVNALVMDSNEKIHDNFNSIDDLEKRIIRTINDPLKRFEEDSLRILRAFRFVSKLGFDIEEKTLEAIKVLASTVKNVSIERVMIELNKIFRGKYRNKALKYMKETGVDKELYNISEGLEFVSNLDIELEPIEVFIICFIFSDISDEWKFSNKHYRLIDQILILQEIIKEDVFNKFIVYVNGLDACLLCNKINVILGYKDQEALIRKLESELPIKDVCDLKFKGQDILWLTTLKKKSVIGKVVDDLKYNVIMGYMPNEYETLKKYALKKVEELQTEMGDNNE